MTKPTSQTFSTLLAAEQPADILQAIAKCIWEADKNEGDPPIPCLSDIQGLTQESAESDFIEVVAFDNHFWVTLSEEAWRASDPPAHVSILRENLSDIHSQDQARDLRKLYNYLADRTLAERNEQRQATWRALMQKLKQEMKNIEGVESPHIQNTTLSLNSEQNEKGTLWLEATANEAEAIANFMLQTEGEPTPERAVTLHEAWLQWRESEQNLQHPLAPIVRAWIQETTAKPITKAYNRKHPVAVIERSRMGSIRDVALFSSLAEELGTLRTLSAPAPESQQIEMPGLETQSILPEVLPLQAVHLRDGIETTKRGAVAMPIRLFFEAIMALEPKETQVDIHFKLGDLLRHLNPDGKYNRTNHLPHVLQGLHSLYFLRIPYRSNPDEPSTEVDWIPVLPRTIPNQNSGDDASIILEVKLPSDARSGMMVEKDILRLTAKKSSAKFNAYLTACWIFDRYGTTPKGIIDPTKPAGNRDDEGYLIDPLGNRIFDDHGKPIKDRYHTRNIETGQRVDNEARERYPILPFAELTRACFPKGYPQRRKSIYLQRALDAWQALANDRILRIEKFKQGWRILPSERHIGHYRAVKRNVY